MTVTVRVPECFILRPSEILNSYKNTVFYQNQCYYRWWTVLFYAYSFNRSICKSIVMERDCGNSEITNIIMILMTGSEIINLIAC